MSRIRNTADTKIMVPVMYLQRAPPRELRLGREHREAGHLRQGDGGSPRQPVVGGLCPHRQGRRRLRQHFAPGQGVRL